jgi:hypothetical protein
LGAAETFIIISRWTETDKKRFDDGLKMFGTSNKKIAEYIGTKTVEQVKERKKWIKKKAREVGEAWPEEERVDFAN